MKDSLYRFSWKNNEKRALMYRRPCRLIAKGKMNSVLIEFTDNGQQEIVSGNSIRRINNEKGILS